MTTTPSDVYATQPGGPGAGLLVPGRNCHEKAPADRVAFLVDAAPYYRAFVAAARRARHSILIAGWDFDSRVCLLRGADAPPGGPLRLGRFLDEVAAATPGLHTHLLAWDFAMIYALEREPLPIFKLGWQTHERVHFHMDDEHPIGASHHQKIVVIDDKLAFVGGLDLTKNRWDRPAHDPQDPDRVDPLGEAFPPFHDVQMLVSGEVAAVLGEVVRERWWRATGQRLQPPPPTEDDPWPPGLQPDVADVPVAVARTVPAYKGYPQVREVETLYLDAIAAAQRWIYIENQYFTSSAIRKALAARLEERDGPEVVVVLPRSTTGWLEEHTMDALRSRLIKRLQAADEHGRFRVLTPVAAGSGSDYIKVHAKVLVVDDRLVRVGSSNLSNRSMGLDTECDLAFEADGDERLAEAVAAFRNRLLAEHCGHTEQEVADALAGTGSLVAAIEQLSDGERRLRPLEVGVPPWLPAVDEDEPFIDPERPVALDRMIDDLLEEDDEDEASSGGSTRSRLIRLGLVLAVLVGLVVFWRFSPVAEWTDRDTLTTWALEAAGRTSTPFVVVGAYVVASLVMFPVTLLIGVTAAVFNPWLALAYGFAGCMAGALVSYWAGHKLGRGTVRTMAGGRLNRLSRRLAQRGLLAVVVVRVLPVAPFTVVNMVAGASHIRLRDFLLGTALGMAPGIAAVTVFVDRLRSALMEPGVENISLLVGVGGVALVLGLWLMRRITRRIAENRRILPTSEDEQDTP